MTVARRILKGDLAFLWLAEWSRGVYHEHLLLRSSRPNGEVREVVRREVRRVELETTVTAVRTVTGAIRYIFGAAADSSQWAEVTPEHFRGHLFGMSRGFLSASVRKLMNQSDSRGAAR